MAAIIFFCCSSILAAFQVQGVKMPTSGFVILIIILSVTAFVASIPLVRVLLRALGATDWQKRRIYQITGFPKIIPVGEQQIPIGLRLGATRYIGRGYVYFVKEKGGGAIVSPDLVTVAFNTEKVNWVPGIRNKGEKLSFVLNINTKSKWNGWLKIGFETEIAADIPYVHLPIIVR